MKRRLVGTLVAALAGIGVFTAAAPASAQEIPLTGPLAGQNSVRKLRQYREGRVEIAVGPGFTLLDQYERTIFVAGRLQYNIWDFLGVGAFGGFGAANLATDLTDKIDATAPRNSRTAINIPGRPGPSYADQTGKLKWTLTAPQVTFSPFRGKLAVFQKLFVDTDLYLHGGLTFMGIQERADCTTCTTPASFNTNQRLAVTGTFGLGLTLYFSNFISMNIEYRATPLKWNRGGFDSAGGGPDASFPDNKIDQEDRSFQLNQIVFVGVGFYLPTKPKISD